MKNKITVIIPVYNDPEGLDETLQSLIQQDYQKDKYEILVCDNNSVDNTKEIAIKYKRNSSVSIKLLEEKERQSPYAARNQGIINSTGEILAFIDADMKVNRDWLEKISNVFNDNETQVIGARVEFFYDKENLATKYDRFANFNTKECIETNKMICSQCISLRKEIFEKFGLYDKRILSYGDTEFGNRLIDNGIELKYHPEIVMFHPARSSLIALLNKYFRTGRGIAQLAYYYPKRYSNLKRILFNPFHIFPPNPKGFYSFIRANREADLSFFKILGLYGIQWMLKVSNHLGFISESLKLQR